MNKLIRTTLTLFYFSLQKHPGYHPEGKDRCVAKAAAIVEHYYPTGDH